MPILRWPGSAAIVGVTVTGPLNGSLLQAANLYLGPLGVSKGSFTDISLNGARIAGTLGMAGATVTGTLKADSLQVTDLILRSDNINHASFETVQFGGCEGRRRARPERRHFW